MITNPLKDKDLQISHRISSYLEKRGKSCMVDAGDKQHADGIYTDAGQVGKEIECVLVLGGDGTLLQASVDLADRNIPFLGINLGTLGFLAEVGVSDIENALEQLIAGEYEIEKRMMLSGVVYQDGQIADNSRALNDIVITRSGSLQVIYFNIYVNGNLLHRYQGDGVIVATPTGSTGYSLSAGGPVVEPKANLILISPICPHSMQNKSIVLSPEDKVTVEIECGRDGSRQEVEAIFDGSHKVSLRTGSRVEIRKSEKVTEIVKLSNDSFLEILHRKMSD